MPGEFHKFVYMTILGGDAFIPLGVEGRALKK